MKKNYWGYCKMKILFIVNPNSGVRSSKNNLIDALDVFSKNDIDVEVYVTQTIDDCYKKVKERGSEFDCVLVTGGDGTCNEAVRGLMELAIKPKLAYIPTGTVNDFANNFNLTKNYRKEAEKIVKGYTKEFDVGKIEDKYFDYVCAFGAFCDVPYSTDRRAKETLGTLAYLLEGINKLTDIKPIDVKIKIDGKEEEMKALFGIVLSGYHVASMEILDKEEGKIDDGEFCVLIVEYIENIFEQTSLLALPLKQKNKYLHWYKSSEIEFEFKEDVKWTYDGEEGKFNKTVKIKNINKALKITC